MSNGIKYYLTHSLLNLVFAVYLDDIPVFRSLIPRSFVVMYADDILLIAPSCGELQLLFQACESELNSLDHRLNGSSSPVLTATPHSYGKGQNSTPYHRRRLLEVTVGARFPLPFSGISMN